MDTNIGLTYKNITYKNKFNIRKNYKYIYSFPPTALLRLKVYSVLANHSSPLKILLTNFMSYLLIKPYQLIKIRGPNKLFPRQLSLLFRVKLICLQLHESVVSPPHLPKIKIFCNHTIYRRHS